MSNDNAYRGASQGQKAPTRKFVRAYLDELGDRVLSPGARLVLWAVRSLIWETGMHDHPNHVIADLGGVSLDTVKRAIKELRAAGKIAVDYGVTAHRQAERSEGPRGVSHHRIGIRDLSEAAGQVVEKPATPGNRGGGETRHSHKNRGGGETRHQVVEKPATSRPEVVGKPTTHPYRDSSVLRREDPLRVAGDESARRSSEDLGGVVEGIDRDGEALTGESESIAEETPTARPSWLTRRSGRPLWVRGGGPKPSGRTPRPKPKRVVVEAVDDDEDDAPVCEASRPSEETIGAPAGCDQKNRPRGGAQELCGEAIGGLDVPGDRTPYGGDGAARPESGFCPTCYAIRFAARTSAEERRVLSSRFAGMRAYCEWSGG